MSEFNYDDFDQDEDGDMVHNTVVYEQTENKGHFMEEIQEED